MLVPGCQVYQVRIWYNCTQEVKNQSSFPGNPHAHHSENRQGSGSPPPSPDTTL